MCNSNEKCNDLYLIVKILFDLGPKDKETLMTLKILYKIKNFSLYLM